MIKRFNTWLDFKHVKHEYDILYICHDLLHILYKTLLEGEMLLFQYLPWGRPSTVI